jgi:GWxTD domain-containing protein
MTRFLTSLLLSLLIVPFAAAATLPELFKLAKEEFSRGEYAKSLADFDALDAASRQPGFEADRAKLGPVILFYRGANLAALGRKDAARAAFLSYLSFMPNAAIANPPYSKEIVETFEAARKESAGKNNSVEAAYARFMRPADWSYAADEKWTDSPVKHLLTSEQKKQYAALTTPAEREAFVTNFWTAFDPTPATPQNEFRAEFERRVAFADANFATAKTPGRDTERGSIFTFLGAPTYIGAASVGTDEVGAMRSGGNREAFGGAGTAGGRGLESDSQRGMRESWYYRQDRLPSTVQAKEVRFDFVTKEGYGRGVMQKDPEPLQALGQAVEAARRDKKLNQ